MLCDPVLYNSCPWPLCHLLGLVGVLAVFKKMTVSLSITLHQALFLLNPENIKNNSFLTDLLSCLGAPLMRSPQYNENTIPDNSLQYPSAQFSERGKEWSSICFKVIVPQYSEQISLTSGAQDGAGLQLRKISVCCFFFSFSRVPRKKQYQLIVICSPSNNLLYAFVLEF